jgi:hypothetical protein
MVETTDKRRQNSREMERDLGATPALAIQGTTKWAAGRGGLAHIAFDVGVEAE